MKNKTIKELLETLLNKQEFFDNRGGLCRWIIYLYIEDVINHEEKELLNKYLKENKPSIFSRGIWIFSNYFWRPGNIKPRIKWIKKHIKLNS